MKQINELAVELRLSKRIAKKLKRPSPLEFLLTIGKLKYSFAGGLPSDESFAVNELAKVTSEAILKKPHILQYGVTRGDEGLIKQIIANTKKHDQIELTESNIITTIGAQYGIFLLSYAFLSDPDSKIIVGNPTYIGAIEAFDLFEPNYLGAEIKEDGMDLEQVESYLKKYDDIKFIYIMPEFQNPTGITLSLEKRKELIKLAKKYNILIVEDSPYRDIRCVGEPIPTIFSMYPEGTVSLRTLSKIAAPGFRVGWVAAHKDIIKALMIPKSASIMLGSTVGEGALADYLMRKKDESLVTKENLEHYRKRRKLILDALDKHMDGLGVSWAKPEGGFVMWFTLPKNMDSEKLLLEFAQNKGVSFLPGKYFYPYPEKSPKHTMRLSYGVINMDLIDEGIKRLAESIKEYKNSL